MRRGGLGCRPCVRPASTGFVRVPSPSPRLFAAVPQIDEVVEKLEKLLTLEVVLGWSGVDVDKA